MGAEAEPEGVAPSPGGAPDARAAARGALSLFVLQTLARGLALLFVVAVARAVVPAEFGRYSIVTGLVLFGSLLADFGTTAAITRTVSRDPTRSEPLLSGTLPVSAVLGLLAYGGAVLFAALADYPPEAVVDVLIGGLTLPLAAVLTSLLGALDGRGLISVRARVTFLQTFVITVGGAVPVLLGAGIRAAIVAVPAGAGVSLLAAAIEARRRRVWTGRFGFDVAVSRDLFRRAVPFALLGGLVAIYRRFDLLVLSLLGTRAQVADYDIALRVLEAVAYLGAMVSAPALFLLSRRLGAGDREGAQRAYDTAARATYLVGLPCSAGLVALHGTLAPALFGRAYVGAAAPIAILGGQVWLEFLGGLQGALLLAGERLRRAVVLEATVMVVLAGLDVALIARYRVVGASVALAIFQLVNVVAFRAFNRRASGLTLPFPPPQLVFAAVVCGAAAWGVGHVSLPLAVVTGVAAYAAVLLATGAVTDADRDMLRRITRAPADHSPDVGS
jgi:O-antigen/teichoic acid export membrane protein